MKTAEEDPDYVNAKLQYENAQILMRELNRIEFLESFRALAPQIVTILREHGVIFPGDKR